MVDWYSCPKCKTLNALIGEAEKKCAICGGTDGEIISGERVKEGQDAGAYFNMGAGWKPTKKKRR